MKYLYLLLSLFIFANVAQAEVVGKEVTYQQDDVMLKGYLAYDDDLKKKVPGVLVVHEWWGHNDYARSRAEKLAEMGYVALAVDMYGEGKQATHPDNAMAFSQEVMKNFENVGRKRFNAALEFLNDQPRVDREKIAAIGYCFGGGVVLNMARLGTNIDAVVSFHGSLNSQVQVSSEDLHAKILVFTGEEDGFVPPEQIEEFEQEMELLNADYQVVVLEDAKHSFTNPKADEVAAKFNLPLAYNREADQASWQMMKNFLEGIFTNKPNVISHRNQDMKPMVEETSLPSIEERNDEY